MPFPAVTASIGGLILPPQFSYELYVQKKRNTITPTANAVVVQHAPDQIIHGDSFLKWKMDSVYPNEYQDLFNLYDTPVPILYQFLGYWGEDYNVYFTKLNSPQFRGRLGTVAGEFQVIQVNSEYDMDCNTGL